MSKALWHIDENHSVLKTAKTTSEGLLIKAKYSMISTGTERLVATNRVPSNMHEIMAVPHMEGSFDFPVKYGYSVVGEVTTKGDFFGKNVHVMHPHQSEFNVDEKNVFVLPDGLSPKKAALISNMETIINAIWDGEVSKGDSILIAGFGNIGSLLAMTLTNHFGVEVTVFEKNDWRRKKAEAIGFKTTERPKDNYYKIAFDTTAASGGLQTCIEAVAEEGVVVNLSWYGNKKVELNLGGSFHYGRKKIISSQVSKIPFSKRKEWDYLKRKQWAAELLMKYPYEQLITHKIPFENSPDFFNKLRQNQQGNGLIWLIKY